MNNVPSYPKRIIESHALFNIMRIVNFPIFIMTAENDDGKLEEQYNAFAESHSGEGLEICEAFYNWEPRPTKGSNATKRKTAQ